ncbi:MAG: hypothetical protein N2662_10830, partial [Bacteroidales bacterium]|nr:hypothetical protein [Bacteroidales bacterium]
LSNNLSSRFAIESDEKNFSVGSDSKANRFTIFLKDAWVQWRFHKYHGVIIGLQGTPPYEVVEVTWGNRFLEKTILDLRGLLSTRELGVALKGQFDSIGIIKYHLLIGNNSPSKPEEDKYKRFYGQITVSPLQNFVFHLYADYQSKQSVADTFINKKVSNDVLISALGIGYRKKDKLMAGIESYISTFQNDYNTGTALVNRNGYGLSAYGTYYFTTKVAAVVRYDYFEPNNKKTGDIRHLFIVACNIKPVEKFTIAPNIVVESFEKTNRTITESVTARISFNWSF